MEKYKIDVCCLQETKISKSLDVDVKACRLVCLPSNTLQYGNGFIISKKWKENVKKYWQVNDRIAVLELTFINSKNNKENRLYVINVYAPHTKRVKDDITELENLYDILNELINNFDNITSSTTVICGDFNAIVGRKPNHESSCLGRHSRGTRNASGQYLIDFCETNDFKIANTCFQHHARHITTWSQQRTNKNTNKIETIYNQIDYILVRMNRKQTLQDARSYSGTECDSDHRLVVCRMSIKSYKMYKRIRTKKYTRYNTRDLVQDIVIQKKYSEKLKENICKIEDVKWESVKSVIIETAEKEVGRIKTSRNIANYSEKVEILSRKRKELRLRIENTVEVEKNRKLRQERNKLSKKIKARLRKDHENRIDKVVEEIEKTKDDTRMFSAIKSLKKNGKENVFLFDEDKKRVTNKKEMHSMIKKYFSSKFYDKNIPKIVPTIEDKPLKKPITEKEVKKCISKMKNNKAGGYDGISVELIKYGNIESVISMILNNIIEKKDNVDLGKSLLIALPKPNKEKGPVANLRPINLLPVIRKILSNITLNRIKNKVNEYLLSSQSAYREGRSTSDIVWAHRWMCAKAQRYVGLTIYITGIDMSSAFDTILRKELIEELEVFLDEDEMRMIELLLSNTTVVIKDEFMCDEFETNIGSPQGDSISGTFFNVYFERELRKVREILNKKKTPIEQDYHMSSSIPEELIYADDSDFVTEDIKVRNLLTNRVADILAEGNLKVNNNKTEQTVIRRGEKSTEDWRHTKKLGSLLGDEEDIARRKTLATATMQNMNKVWVRNKKVSIKKRLKLYNALVKPVLTYNSSTWGITKSQSESIDAFHRKQLRKIWKINWKNKISNEKIVQNE